MAKKEKSKEQLKAQIQILKAKVNSNTTARSIEAFSKWGGIALIANFAKESFGLLAGKETWAHIQLVAEGCSIESKWALIIGGSLLIIGTLCAITGILYGRWQHKLRCDVIKEKSDRIKFLESFVDKKRSTSGLSETGQTTEGR